MCALKNISWHHSACNCNILFVVGNDTLKMLDEAFMKLSIAVFMYDDSTPLENVLSPASIGFRHIMLCTSRVARRFGILSKTCAYVEGLDVNGPFNLDQTCSIFYTSSNDLDGKYKPTHTLTGYNSFYVFNPTYVGLAVAMLPPHVQKFLYVVTGGTRTVVVCDDSLLYRRDCISLGISYDVSVSSKTNLRFILWSQLRGVKDENVAFFLDDFEVNSVLYGSDSLPPAFHVLT